MVALNKEEGRKGRKAVTGNSVAKVQSSSTYLSGYEMDCSSATQELSLPGRWLSENGIVSTNTAPEISC